MLNRGRVDILKGYLGDLKYHQIKYNRISNKIKLGLKFSAGGSSWTPSSINKLIVSLLWLSMIALQITIFK